MRWFAGLSLIAVLVCGDSTCVAQTLKEVPGTDLVHGDDGTVYRARKTQRVIDKTDLEVVSTPPKAYYTVPVYSAPPIYHTVPAPVIPMAPRAMPYYRSSRYGGTYYRQRLTPFGSSTLVIER